MTTAISRLVLADVLLTEHIVEARASTVARAPGITTITAGISSEATGLSRHCVTSAFVQ